MPVLVRSGLLVAALALLPLAAPAQTMTAEEILKRIQSQREALARQEEEAKTRTLSFVGASNPAPSNSEAAAVVATEPAQPVAPDAAQVEPAAVTSPSATAAVVPQTPGSLVNPDATGTPPQAPATSAATLTAPGVEETAPAGLVATPGSTFAASKAGTPPTLVDAVATETVPVYSNDLAIDLVIYFEFDSAILKKEAKAQLDQLCVALKQDTGSYQIIGHTDAAGSDSYNLTLSKARAEEVMRHLVNTCGIPPERLRALGLGEARLKNAGDPRDAVNRRVEIQVSS